MIVTHFHNFAGATPRPRYTFAWPRRARCPYGPSDRLLADSPARLGWAFLVVAGGWGGEQFYIHTQSIRLQRSIYFNYAIDSGGLTIGI